jgi:antitoxin (DNA-binding transcriptional repressor) of toxin-antitoxin stability system
MQIISATELARNTRQILDKVVSQGDAVTIERNHSVIAQIVPAPKQMNAAQILAGLATRPALSTSQAKRWLKASKSSFDNGLKDPWV